MPIQTSQITTDANGDLTIAPNGTGETKVASVDVTRADAGTTEDTPVALAQDGTVKKVDLSTLPELSSDNLSATDFIAVQKADGDFYHLKAEDLASAGLINPDPGGGGNATLNIVPAPTVGDGSAGNPFVLTSVVVTTPGGTEQTVEVFDISGAPANGILYVTFTDNQGGRFQDKVVVADAAGNIPAFQLTFIDEPESTVGTVYTGKVRFGTSSTYFQWAVTQQASSTDFNGTGSGSSTSAPNASPASVANDGYFGTGTGTWADGTKTLSSTTNVLFQLNGGGFTNGPLVANNGDTIDVVFLQSAVDSAASGATISGDLSSSDNTFFKSFSMVKDSDPTVSFGSTSNAALSTSTSSGSVTPTGFNSTIAVTTGTAGANEMTNILASINGGAFSALPQNISPGDTLSVQGDTGSASNTTYTVNVNVGGTAATYSATTSATSSSPTISKPGITSPTTGSTGLTIPVSLASSAYIGNNGAGPHTTSDWQVYEAASGAGAPTTEPPNSATYTLVLSSISDPTNLTSYSLTASEIQSGKAYYSRVRYNDDGSSGTTATSDFSEYNEFEVQPPQPPTTWNAVLVSNEFGQDVVYDPNNARWHLITASGATAQAFYTDDLLTWTRATYTPGGPTEFDVTWRAITAGPDKLVGVGKINDPSIKKHFMYSTDSGDNYIMAPSPVSQDYIGVEYGNGRYVAVAGNVTTQINWSLNGINWVTAASHPGGGYTDIAYGNGVWVAVAWGNQTAYSTDNGENWTAATAANGNQWHAVTYGNGLFVAVARGETSSDPNRVMYSSDGINWTGALPSEPGSWYDVCFGAGYFFAVSFSGGNRFMYSSDAINWTPIADPVTPQQWEACCFGGGAFVAVSRQYAAYSFV